MFRKIKKNIEINPKIIICGEEYNDALIGYSTKDEKISGNK